MQEQANTDHSLFEAYRNNTLPNIGTGAVQKFKNELHQFTTEYKESIIRFDKNGNQCY